jgi:hypothetical protein
MLAGIFNSLRRENGEPDYRTRRLEYVRFFLFLFVSLLLLSVRQH